MTDVKDTTLRYEMPSKVRGTVRTRQTTAVTSDQTTEHDAPSVTNVKGLRQPTLGHGRFTYGY